MDEKLLVPVVLVPVLVFLLGSIPVYGYLLAGIIATIACAMVGLTGKIEIKEIAFITGLNLLILLIYLYLFRFVGVNITIDEKLVNFAVGGLVGGFLAWLVKK